jgi:hypothetical protein
MKHTLILGVFAGLAAAAPAPQLIDLDGVASIVVPEAGPPDNLNVAQPDAYDAAAAKNAAIASVQTGSIKAKRTDGSCAPQESWCTTAAISSQIINLWLDGYGPKASPDTPDGFYAFQTFADQSSQAPTPKAYAPTFKGHTGSCNSGTYLGLFFFKTYDPYLCQQKCDSHPDGCTSFNIFFERDPTVDAGPGCANPPSFTTIRCTLWKNTLMTKDGAGNDGQWRLPKDANGRAFHVVNAGSNGYLKDVPPPSFSGYNGPDQVGGAINAPLDSGVDTYMGYKFYPNGDYSQCTAACTAQTAYNGRHPPSDGSAPKICRFVNAYLLSKNNIAQGVYCSMYTRAWDRSYGTNYGQYRGNDRYTVANSYGYTLQ